MYQYTVATQATGIFFKPSKNVIIKFAKNKKIKCKKWRNCWITF